MAHGALLGQTPILNAEGIEYDNSTTSGVITANNVQQAIDESVKKIQDVVKDQSKFEIIAEGSFNKTIFRPETIEVVTDMTKFSGYYLVVVEIKGTGKCNDTYDTIGVYLEDKGNVIIAELSPRNSRPQIMDGCVCLLPQNQGKILVSGNNSVSSFKLFVAANYSTTYNFTYKIYGLKLPTF